METDEQLKSELEALDAQTRSLIVEADLGRQAREFFQTDVGKYILGCVSQEVIAAQMQLADVNWWNLWKVRSLQNQIWRAKSLVGWLADLVRQGKNAEAALAEGE